MSDAIKHITQIMGTVCIWIDSSLLNGKLEEKLYIDLIPAIKTVQALIDAIQGDKVITEVMKSSQYVYEIVLCTIPHGTALDEADILEDIWKQQPEKLLFLSDISRTGKCMRRSLDISY